LSRAYRVHFRFAPKNRSSWRCRVGEASRIAATATVDLRGLAAGIQKGDTSELVAIGFAHRTDRADLRDAAGRVAGAEADALGALALD